METGKTTIDKPFLRNNLSSKVYLWVNQKEAQNAVSFMRDTYMVEYVAQAFRHKPNIRSLTPDKKIQSNVKKLELLLLMFCNIMTDPTRQNKIEEIKMACTCS
jgi:hypothetical protein